MNVMFEAFPQTVEVDGKEYKIVTDFREWIKLHELFQNTRKFSRATLDMILDWYEDDPPEDDRKAVRALQDFLLAESLQEDDFTGEKTGQRVRQPEKPSFSFSQDAILIYSAFREIYGIDITNIPYMHWWQFLVLFWGLPENTQIKERIYYRSVDLNDIESKEERKRIKKIKKLVALKENNRRKMDAYEIGDVFG